MAGWVWSDLVLLRLWNACTWMSLPRVLSHRTAHMFRSQSLEIDHGVIPKKKKKKKNLTNVLSLNQAYSWESQQLWVHGFLHSTSLSFYTLWFLPRRLKSLLRMQVLGQLGLERVLAFIVMWAAKQQPINTVCYNARKKRKRRRRKPERESVCRTWGGKEAA